ncbi:PEP-CTERM sorting domain-containing protein [Planctomycetota bacterium]|nr:PEP-CTERM sorting domain-containing protein [Planctomycetota bacterium]
MRKLSTLTAGLATFVVAASANAAIQFTNYGYLAPIEGNRVRIDVAELNGSTQLVYTTGRRILTADMAPNLTESSWTQISNKFAMGDPSFAVVNPFDNTKLLWGQGGGFDVVNPMNIVSGLDTSSVTFSDGITPMPNVYDAQWRSENEMYVVAKLPTNASSTNRLLRIYEDAGAWQTQEIIEFTNEFLYSGAMTLDTAGNVYMSNSSGKIFKFTAGEINAAIANDTKIQLDGDSDADAHYLTNLGTSGSFEIVDNKLFASGWELTNTLKSFDLETGVIAEYIIDDAHSSNYGYQLAGYGDQLFAIRDGVDWSTFTFGNSILWGATIPEPTSLALFTFASLGMLKRRARK